jgi:hypothetical protein
MGTTVNKGNQILTWDYLNASSSESFNRLLKDIVRPGIYEGGLVDVIDASTASINPMSVLIVPENNSDLAVKVRVQDPYQITVDQANPYLICEIDWINQEDNFLDFVVQNTPASGNQLNIALLNFSGATFTSVDYSNSDRIDNTAATQVMGNGVTINPTGGSAVNIPGTDFVSDVIQFAFERIMDLTSTENDAVKIRHIDETEIGAASLQINSVVPMGGTEIDLTAGQFISQALITIANSLATMSGANDNAVRERHLNWGSGAGGINTTQMPIGQNFNFVIGGSFGTLSISATETVSQAIQKIGDKITEIGVNLNTANGNILGLQASTAALNLADINTEFFPVGMIMTFDGTGWVDPNVDPNSADIPSNSPTMPGWWACTEDNFNSYGLITPNLENFFLSGGGQNARGVDYGIFGGSDQIILSVNQLPNHVHPMDHTHTGSTDIAGGSHQHNISHTHPLPAYEWDSGGSPDRIEIQGNDGDDSANLNTGGPSNANSGFTNIDHSHSFTIPFVGVTGNSLSTNNDPITNIPAHYKVVLIRKCRQE